MRSNGFIYMWINLINGKLYLGSHWGTDTDGYIGSGVVFKRAVKKYGLENFKRIILEQLYYNSRTELKEIESVYLTRLNAAGKYKFYNLTNNSGSSHRSLKSRIKQRRTLIGRKQSLEQVENRMKKLRGINNPHFKGFWVTPHGAFAIASDAAKLVGCSYRCVMDRCKRGNIDGWFFKEWR